MKPKRSWFLSHRSLAPVIRYGVPAWTGVHFLVCGLDARAGDLLRPGGGTAATTPGTTTPATGAATVPSETANATRARAKDLLRRTDESLQAVRKLQASARAAALATPSSSLNPPVANGLAEGGLQVAPQVSTNPDWWKGANAPTQTATAEHTTVTIRQTEQQALLQWKTFNVGKETTVKFDQSSGGANANQWIAFNWINDPTGNPSRILGNITAQGQVYLINPNGILFGGSSQINLRGLTASALPINRNLVERGLLNNPSSEFLFDGLTGGSAGNVTVQAGASIASPVGDDGNGGRVVLAGANVTNHGTISTPNGQTILAAGLQVGLAAHETRDPSLRGLDVFVGSAQDLTSGTSLEVGSVLHTGLIESARGNITLTGKRIEQSGFLESSTSVSLNGSVNLNASYGAVRNPVYDSANTGTGSPFNFNASGTITWAAGSVTRILPESQSADRTTGTELALRSQISATGLNLHLADGAVILAPNAKVNFQAGEWKTLPSGPAAFLNTTGRIHFDPNSTISLAGSTGATASVLQNFLTVTLRGAEFSVAPLQRNSELRGSTVVVDISKSGTYNGRNWIGTPLADVSGYLGIIERDVAQLTTAGGDLRLSAGEAVVLNPGATIDVSGGWTEFTGDTVQTSRVLTQGRLVDISEATPDVLYSGVFTGTTKITLAPWGGTQVLTQALAPSGQRYQAGYIQGANGGSLEISAPSLALDGGLLGQTVTGPKQNRTGNTSSHQLPGPASLQLRLQAQQLLGSSIRSFAPTSPEVVFGSPALHAPTPFVLDASGKPLPLADGRVAQIDLPVEWFSSQGFGKLSVVNEGGNILIPQDVTLSTSQAGALSLTAANIGWHGTLRAPGASVSLTTLNLTSFQSELLTDDQATPPPNAGRGQLTLGSTAVIDVAGNWLDERLGTGSQPIFISGGNVNLAAYQADLQAGALVDVSGGYWLSQKGAGTHGAAGSISISAGKDPGKHTTAGGELRLASTLKGFSGTKGGSLSLQAPRIQLGGSSSEAGTLVLDPAGFASHGFAGIQLNGLGIGSSPGLWVTPGTRWLPVVSSQDAVIDSASGSLQRVIQTRSTDLREAARLTLGSSGIRDLTTVELGDVVIGRDALIQTDPGGSIKITGNLVTIDGSVIAPGGSVSVSGGATSVFGPGLPDARFTTLIGSGAVLSAAGTVIHTPDPYGRRLGKVFAGGNVSLSGNLAIATGALIDVSGTSAVLDWSADAVSPAGQPITPRHGLYSLPGGLQSTPVRFDSDGGTISLKGTELLRTGATLRAFSGGSTALGGTLSVSSGIYDPTGIGVPASEINLTVSQTGTPILLGTADTPGNAGRFAIDDFSRGGFDSLTLEGVVSFDGPVQLSARRDLQIATSGFLYANQRVNLEAGHLTLGKPQSVVLPTNVQSPFAGSVLPSPGKGELVFRAGSIDVGHLSLQQISQASLIAENGVIRGAGTFQMAGTLGLQAGLIHPNSASKLHFIAYDTTLDGSPLTGGIHISSSGQRGLPLSAGGTLAFHASVISQNGTLRAPFGSIQLGWDGTGTPPSDLLAGSGAAARFPVTRSLNLGPQGITSVSAIDPLTGKGVVIPYGISTNGENWIDPRGVDITSSGLPGKSIVLSGGEVTTQTGSVIDLRGGGDLFAFQWIKGLGGLTDVLASTQSFAVIPDYTETAAPVAEFNTSTDSGNRIAGYSGYSNPTLKVGDRIYLSASSNLPAGHYTLLPARYALLPGAVLVTPVSGTGSTTVERADTSSVVAGYRYNQLNTVRDVPEWTTRFEIASPSVVRARAEYRDFLSSRFHQAAASAGSPALRLPQDSGHLVFQTSGSLSLSGSVSSRSISGGRGASIDISTPLSTWITSVSTAFRPPSGSLRLDAATLSSFGAETLFIGGRRDGNQLTVTTSQLTLDHPDATLAASDLILAANETLTVSDGSVIRTTGTLSGADALASQGNGALIRVSQDPAAAFSRTAVTAGSARLSIGSGATVHGAGITFDSSADLQIAPDASLLAQSYQFNAGRVSLMLQSGLVEPTGGLVVSNALLSSLGSAASLGLRSASSIDLHGSGAFGSVEQLARLSLQAGEIRSFGPTAGTTTLSAAALRLGNPSGAGVSTSLATAGNLRFSANTIELENGLFSVRGYDSVYLDATAGISGSGSGGLAAQRHLTLTSPLVTASAGAKRSFSAGGDLGFASATGPSRVTPGLGASLVVQGNSVVIGGDVSLPSGSISVRALSGDLTVHAGLSVSGSTRTFHDTQRAVQAGSISLAADQGHVRLGAGSVLDLSAAAGGGDAGQLSISAPGGTFLAGGTIRGGSSNGLAGSLTLDVSALPVLSTLNRALSGSGLSGSRSIRVRSGDIVMDGLTQVRNLLVSADQGNIDVTGTLDASGPTGGSIRLAARGNVTLQSGARLSVAGTDFNAAGKGGTITLEAGASSLGGTGVGSVGIRQGSVMDLSVASWLPGSAESVGSSAYQGKFTGQLHLRAPRTANQQDLLVDPILGEILGASSIVAEGYRIYDLSGSGAITSTVLTNIRNDATTFLGAAGAANANSIAISNRLASGVPSLADLLVVAPGVEIIQSSGDLTLGTATSTTTSDWNLSSYRYGAKSAPGVLTLRASGNLVLYNAISDGFSPTLANTDPAWLWTARLSSPNPLLPAHVQSWSYRFTAGADLAAADVSLNRSLASLGENAGFIKLGKFATNTSTGTGSAATTASAIANRYQVIRTGTGDISLNAGRSVQLLNQFATIYTAGARVADPTLAGTFRTPNLNLTGLNPALGGAQQSYIASYSMAGGNVSIQAGQNIEHLTLSGGQVVADSQLQMPTNWLYRRGFVDDSGTFGESRWGESASTTWWVDFSNFFQGVGALGGGNVSLTAGGDVRNVDAVIPTNARMPGYTSSAQTARAVPVASSLLELGGGDLHIRAGNDLDAGVYYVERGNGSLFAGGAILTNSTRSVISPSNLAAGQASVWTELPTTLFAGKAAFQVRAGGDLLLGPVANPFALPGGLLNSFWYKSYFSTFSGNASVDAVSLGGNVTLRNAATLPGQTAGSATPLLQGWFLNKLLFSSQSASNQKPWLRLNETSVAPFQTWFSVQPGTLRATALSGDLSLTGRFNLSPSASGTVELLAAGSIHGFTRNGSVSISGVTTTTWGAASLNLSDALPSAIPGISTPFAYQKIVGTSNSAGTTGSAESLLPLNRFFAESGGFLGENSVLQTKQALHAPGLLHKQDTSPARIYALDGSLSGLTLFTPKATRAIAGGDLSDVAFYFQNLSEDDVSIVTSGGDLKPFLATSDSRVLASAAGNAINLDSGPLAGDLQIGGPGTLEVLAGRDLDLGSGAAFADGTGAGITSIGNARNPYLPYQGANLLLAAGIGPAPSLRDSGLRFGEFISSLIASPAGVAILREMAPDVVFDALDRNHQARLALEVFFRMLRNAGRSYANSGNYDGAWAAIRELFGTDFPGQGRILARAKDIRTTSGGNISLLAPGGGVSLAEAETAAALSPPGIITEAGGHISVFSRDSVNIGIGRIFTLRGGNAIIWSSKGDIAAGSSSKTVKSAPPTRVLIDPQSAAVKTDLSGLATGGGIGVLATVKGIAPGDVDLIAPLGSVDAGDAGIRVTGNLNVAATRVLNSANISVSGKSSGAAGATVSQPAATTLASASRTSAASSSAANTERRVSNQEAQPTPQKPAPIALPTVFTVEVIGYGGSDADEEEDKEEQEPTQ